MRNRLFACVASVCVAVLCVGALSAPAGAATPKPKVTSLSVTVGPVSGGTKIVIKGSGFTKVKKVLIGRKAGTRLKVTSKKSLTVYTPKGTAGPVAVRVVTKSGTSASNRKSIFRYRATATAGPVPKGPDRPRPVVPEPPVVTDPSGPSDPEAPAAPTGLVATGGDQHVALSWDGSSEADLAGYYVYRLWDAGNDAWLVLADPSTVHGTELTDSDVQNGTAYTYAVAAVDQAGNVSPWSVHATATPTNQTGPTHCGEITREETWPASMTHRVTCEVFVRDGALLTIEPGSTVLGTSEGSVHVDAGGRLVAQGTAGSPITFAADDAGDWGGLRFEAGPGGASVTLGHVAISGADTALAGTVQTEPLANRGAARAVVEPAAPAELMADSVSITAPTTCLTLAGQVSGHFQGSVRECATGVQAAYSFDARDVDWGGEEGPGLTTPAAQGPVDTYPWKGTTTPPSPQLRPTPTPDPTGTCKDIAVIGVMGSGQRPTAGPLGMGAEVNAVHAKFSEIYGADRVRSVALDYPAKAVPLTENEAPLIAGYIESAWDGTYSLMQALRQQADTCATFDEKVVLVGYSQGAWVIHATVQYLEARKSPLLDRIAGVGLLADPLRSTASDAGLVYAGTAKPEIERLGGSKGIARTKIPNATLEYHKWSAGVFESLIAPGRDIDNVPLSASTYPSRLASSTMSYCDDHDMVCGWSSDQTNSKAPHEAYKNSDNPAVATMAEFLASAASNDQWTSIDSSFGHGCGTRRGGTLWCWGANSKGQLGVGDTVNRASPTRVGTTTNWESVSVGDDFSCAVTTSGELWCWGSASVGQLAQGDGRSSYDNATTPLRVGTDTEWDVVDAGSRAACAIRTDRTLWCWGVLYGGGDIFDDIFGVTSYYPQPKQVGTGADWQSLAAGDQSVCAIKTAGTLWCWGSNGSGRLGTGGSLFKTDVPQRVGVARTWKYVSDSTESACAIASDDSLWCWGANSSGQLGTGDQVGRPMPTQVGIGKRWSQVDTTAAPSVTMAHTCATDTDGELWCWGRGVDSLTQVVSVPVPTRTGARDGWSNLTVAGQNNCAGRKDGSLWCWRLGGTPALAPVAG